MELTEEELKKVLAGTNQNFAEEQSTNNEELFRKEKIEDLKQQREKIIASLDEKQTKSR